MKKRITIVLLSFIALTGVMGCASVGTKYIWDEGSKNILGKKGKWKPVEKYECKGTGCNVDFKNQTMEGGSFMPTLPAIKL